MSGLKGTNVYAPIVPGTTEDKYPTHYSEYGKGGRKSVATIEERNAIPKERLEVGTEVFVASEGISYVLLSMGGDDPTKWEWEKSPRFKDLENVSTDGYQFMGIANPDTDPAPMMTNLTAKYYFIATEAGTYLRFNNAIVPNDGCAYLLKYNKGWTSEKTSIAISDFNTFFYFGLTEPENHDRLWCYPDELNSLPLTEDNPVVVSMLKAISALLSRVDVMEYAFTGELDFGGMDNNAIRNVDTSITIDPGTGEVEIEGEEGEGGEDEGVEPTQFKNLTPNGKHLRIKRGELSELTKYRDEFLSGELLWCDKDERLYIKKKDGSMYWINKSTGGGGEVDPPDPENPDDLENMAKVDYVDFIASSDKTFRMKVDVTGKLLIYDSKLDEVSVKTPEGSVEAGSGKIYMEKLFINMIYCGGVASNERSYNYCSHNFIELANVSGADINLNGLSIQYCAGSGVDWKVLPLKGVIKNGSTFLIRGKQCSYMDVNTTRIKVGEPDMEWDIAFSNTAAKFYLCYGTEPCIRQNPKTNDNSESPVFAYGYIDLVGFTNNVDTIDASEGTAFKNLNSDRIMMRYYPLDNVSQAIKASTARDNSKDWYYIDLTKNLEYNIEECYVPKNSTQGKNLFFNKHKLEGSKPNMVTCSFGRQATVDGSKKATRCFNWISVGYYDEYLFYRKKGSGSFTKVESIKDPESPYNRIRVEASNGQLFTAHKYILKELEAGEYEYKVGRDESGYISDVYTFVVKTKEEAASFGFVQVSDQQGFNQNEYIVWKTAADKIEEWETDSGKKISETHTSLGNSTGLLDFIVNTGDMTQNGNRINEWVDYYNGGLTLWKKYPQMCTVGNNDLSPLLFYQLGNGSDKYSPECFGIFYCYEYDEENTLKDINGKPVPSCYSFDYGDCHFICVNSEEVEQYPSFLGIYPELMKWVENDLRKSTAKWKIAFCHESPFTILTSDNLANANKGSKDRSDGKGSKLNETSVYLFSRLLEHYGVQLCLCGHKHTYSQSFPLRENVLEGDELSRTATIDGNKPKIFVTQAQLDDPNFKNPEGNKGTDYQVVESIRDAKAVVYTMCQATGFKLVSNKELPAQATEGKIKWLQNYFPKTGASTANPLQRQPNYIKWDITPEGITGYPYQARNILDSSYGFNINTAPSGEKTRSLLNDQPTDVIKISE